MQQILSSTKRLRKWSQKVAWGRGLVSFTGRSVISGRTCKCDLLHESGGMVTGVIVVKGNSS